MPVNREKKFTFIHIPKVAGTSIEKHLGLYGEHEKFSLKIGFGRFEQNGETYALQHISHQQLLELGIINQEEFDTNFSFSFVRNPWDRAVSDYKWHKNVLKKNITFRKYLQNINKVYDSYKSSRIINYDNCHYVPQSWYITDDKNVSTVSYIGKYENLSEDFNIVLSQIDNENNTLQETNKGKSIPYLFYFWDIRNIFLVNKVYKEDIVNFNYNFFRTNAFKLFMYRIKKKILKKYKY